MSTPTAPAGSTAGGPVVVASPCDPATARRTLAVAVAGVLVGTITFSGITTTVRSAVAALGAGATSQTWILSGMSLGLAATFLAVGAAGDRFGHRRMFIASGIVVAAGALLAAAAPAGWVLAVARIVEGVGSAGQLATGLAMLRGAYRTREERSRASGLWAAALGFGVAAGPVVNGWLDGTLGWRSSHALSVLIAIVATVGALAARPDDDERVPRRVDVPGSVTATAAMAALTAGITSGRTGWASPTTIGLLVVGVIASVVFVAVERRRAAPLTSRAALRAPEFRIALLGSFAGGAAMIAIMSTLPVVLEGGLRLAAVAAGGVVAIWSLTGTISAATTARLPGRWGHRGLLVGALVLVAVGNAGLAVLHPAATLWWLVPGLVVTGLGYGVANAVVARLSVEAGPPAETGSAVGATNAARYLGAAIGTAAYAGLASSGGTAPSSVTAGWNVATVLAGAVSLIAAVLVVVLGRPRTG